jgi:hypothetical protein
MAFYLFVLRLLCIEEAAALIKQSDCHSSSQHAVHDAK